MLRPEKPLGHRASCLSLSRGASASTGIRGESCYGRSRDVILWPDRLAVHRIDNVAVVVSRDRVIWRQETPPGSAFNAYHRGLDTNSAGSGINPKGRGGGSGSPAPIGKVRKGGDFDREAQARAQAGPGDTAATFRQEPPPRKSRKETECDRRIGQLTVGRRRRPPLGRRRAFLRSGSRGWARTSTSSRTLPCNCSSRFDLRALIGHDRDALSRQA
jgi:hypothetical protein